MNSSTTLLLFLSGLSSFAQAIEEGKTSFAQATEEGKTGSLREAENVEPAKDAANDPALLEPILVPKQVEPILVPKQVEPILVPRQVEPILVPRQYVVVSPGVYGMGMNTGFQPNIYGINRPLGLGQSGALLQPAYGTSLGGLGVQGYQVMPQMGIPAVALATGGMPVTGIMPAYGGYGYGGYGHGRPAYGGSHYGYSGGGHHG